MTNKPTDILTELKEKTPVFSSRNIIEAIALLENKKKVMRLVVNDSSSRFIVPSMLQLGFAVVRSKFRLKTSYTTHLGDVYTEFVEADDPEADDFIIMVAKDIGMAKYAINLEDDGDAAGQLGDLLGYPECCVSAYKQISEKNDWLTVYLSNTPHRSFYPYGANKIAYLFGEKSLFFDYFPCSMTCEDTCNLSVQMTLVLEKYQLSGLRRDIRNALMTPILIRKGVIVSLRNAFFEDDRRTLVYDLGQATMHGWKVTPEADKDFVWESNRLRKEGETLFFYKNEKYLGHFVEEIIDNRMFSFEQECCQGKI